jgi:peptidoglycan/LPS O-acetylase OafA/YrhL
VIALRELPFRLRRITSTKGYRPEIDGLRFFAIAFVVAGHLMERVQRAHAQVEALSATERLVFDFAHPGIGVSLFFAISGFIIAAQFLKSGGASLRLDRLKTYFLRRVTRIEPPYLILLLVTFALLELSGYRPSDLRHFGGQPQSLPLSLVASLSYLHGVLFGSFPRLFPPGWSLEIEVQFYILAPVLFFAYLKIKECIRRISFGIAAIAIVCVLGPLYPMPFTVFDHFHYFWIGIIIADASTHLKGSIPDDLKRWASLAGWVGVALMIGAGLLENQPGAEAVVFRLLTSGAIVLMFSGAFHGASFRAVCSHPWISLLGGACYSIYLTHLQLIQIATSIIYRMPVMDSVLVELGINMALQPPLIFGAGLVFYAVIERPFMLPGWPSLVFRRYLRPGLFARLLKAHAYARWGRRADPDRVEPDPLRRHAVAERYRSRDASVQSMRASDGLH